MNININMKCVECGKETVEKIFKKEEVDVRGDKILIDVSYYKCNSCEATWEKLNDEEDYLDTAYRIYRKKHNMLQPEEIKDLRKRYSLTQGELARLLGWGAITLTRYENGALQDHAHDSALQLLKDPKNVRALLKQRSQIVEKEKLEQLDITLKNLIEEKLDRDFIEVYFDYLPDIWSGYSSFSFEKCINMILFFCKDGIYKTKLNKLLFYADFKHFKEYTISITGLRYIHAPYGPVPKLYSFLLSSLLEKNLLNIREINLGCNQNGEDLLAEEYASVEGPDLNIFSDSDLQIMLFIKKFFSEYGSRKISEFSHREPAYMNTKNNEEISYEYAKDIQI